MTINQNKYDVWFHDSRHIYTLHVEFATVCGLPGTCGWLLDYSI